jgi:hypothetical protein
MSSNTRRLKLAEAKLIGWEQCFGTSVGGYKLEICIAFSVVGDQVTMELAVVVGGSRYAFHESISGNQCFSLPVLGFEIEPCVSNWEIGQQSVSFTLTVSIVVFFKVKVFEERITIPLPEPEEVGRLAELKANSPQELLHALALLSSVETGAPGAGAASGGCACGCGAAAGAAAGRGAQCPPNPNLIGPCYEGSGNQIPGKWNCAACCALRNAEWWRNPQTGALVNCE